MPNEIHCVGSLSVEDHPRVCGEQYIRITYSSSKIISSVIAFSDNPLKIGSCITASKEVATSEASANHISKYSEDIGSTPPFTP